MIGGACLAGCAALWLAIAPAAAADLAPVAADLAPSGTLHAVYLGGNPAQAVRDPASGEIRGVAADLARLLAKRMGVPLALAPSANPQTVIDAVSAGEVDIGFVAYAAARVGNVEFSQTYMLVHESFLVPKDSLIGSVRDIDRAGQRIAGRAGDSITLYLKQVLKHATLVEIGNNPFEPVRMLATRDIDAFAANRQRLADMMADLPELRILPDNIFDVPQTIIVPKGKPRALAEINHFIDEVRASGYLRAAIESSGVAGLQMAPAGYGYGPAEVR